MGYHLDDDELNKVFKRFKALADKKKTVSDADLEALVGDEVYQPQGDLGVGQRAGAVRQQRHPHGGGARCAMPRRAQTVTDAGFGTGPVDAVYQGINRIVQVPNVLTEFLVQAVTEGIDANGDVTIRIAVPESRGYSHTAQGRPRRRLFSGRGIDTDIIVASAKAYMQALNKLIDAEGVEQSTVHIVNGERSAV